MQAFVRDAPQQIISARMASFNERLVRQVQKHKNLWDHRSTLQKESEKRDAAWMDVAAELIATVEKCRTRWRTLRDSYVKRKRHPSSRTRGRWDLLEHKLRFLDDHLRPPRRSQVRRAAVKSKPEHETNPGGCTPVVPLPLLEAEYGADMELSLLPDVTPRSPIPLPPPSPVVQERSEDPVELFCLGLAPQLKRLMPRERMKAEMWVLQVLHGLEHGLVGADVDPQAAGSAPENLGA
ncbi:uncharacterized protein LOC144141551 isoform X1 [Haemaphysalis longicornis]